MLPSSRHVTPSVLAMVPASTALPLNEKADVRAATFSASIFDSAFSSSSARPSQKCSSSTSALMLANGSTASEVSVGASGWTRSAATRNAGTAVAVDDSSYRMPRTRAVNADEVSPPGNRVQWRSRNRPGTRAAASDVASITTGSRNVRSSAIRCERSTASFHSSRK